MSALPDRFRHRSTVNSAPRRCLSPGRARHGTTEISAPRRSIVQDAHVTDNGDQAHVVVHLFVRNSNNFSDVVGLWALMGVYISDVVIPSCKKINKFSDVVGLFVRNSNNFSDVVGLWALMRVYISDVVIPSCKKINYFFRCGRPFRQK